MADEHDLHIRLKDGLFQALKKLARANHRSVAAEIAVLMEQYVRTEEMSDMNHHEHSPLDTFEPRIAAVLSSEHGGKEND